jgi:hypothetical protein
MATQAQLAAVQQLYVGYLGRAADAAGQKFWADAIANGTATIQSVATGFTLSAEYKAAYAGLSNDALVDKVYTNVLGRTSDAAGKAFWVNALATGTVTADTMVATIVTNLGALDQTTINNKVFVAQTYTDTAGANYNVAAGTASIVGVNSTAASVTTALGNISNGTLAGLVPGQAQINALIAAKDAVTAFEKATATGTLASADADKNGSVTLAELNTASAAAVTAHDNAVGPGVTTATATATLTNLTATTTSAKAAAVTASSAAAVANLDAALANKAAVTGTAADQAVVAAAKASAIAGFGSAFGATSQTTVTLASLDSKTLVAGDITGADAAAITASVYAALISTTLSAAERAALVAEVNKVGPTGVALVAAADKEVAVNKATTAVDTATATVNGAGTTGTDYVAAAAAQKAQADKVALAVKADADVAAIKVVIDAHTALDNAVVKAGEAVTALNSTKVAIADISGNVAADVVNGDAAKADVFYFGVKAPSAADVTIGTFGAGDSIVVGSGYTFNAGALTTGNNSVSEMFLVQGANGVQIVLESSVFGSATATTGTNGVVAASTTDGVSVITLTGVTIDHVSVANGVISYV